MTLRILALRAACAAAALSLTLPSPAAAAGKTDPMTPDIPAKFAPPTTANDYVKRVEMVPMRDGVKLYTVIVMPKGAHDAPILLTRTPYNAKKRAERNVSPHIDALLAQMELLRQSASFLTAVPGADPAVDALSASGAAPCAVRPRSRIARRSVRRPLPGRRPSCPTGG